MSDPQLTRAQKPGQVQIVDRMPAVTSAAASIVPMAAAILREEMEGLASRGLGGLPHMPRAHLPSSGAPVEQLREQARSLVDTVVRMLGHPAAALGAPAAHGGASNQGDAADRESVLVLRTGRAVAGGGVSHLSLRLENGDTDADDCVLYVTDLVGPAGHRIPASHVRVIPERVRIPGGASSDVRLEVRVPTGVPAGCYTGLVQADDGQAVRALFQVVVSE